MGIDEARAHLRRHGRETQILELTTSTATVALAAQALGTEEGRIAKTLSFAVGARTVLVVAAGHSKVDNQKFRAQFGTRADMLPAGEVLERVGHPVGGVCPFGVREGVEVYLDGSLREFDHVFPACGSQNTAIRLTCDELEQVSQAQAWVDVCKDR